jgi:hypothetical protein
MSVEGSGDPSRTDEQSIIVDRSVKQICRQFQIDIATKLPLIHGHLKDLDYSATSRHDQRSLNASVSSLLDRASAGKGRISPPYLFLKNFTCKCSCLLIDADAREDDGKFVCSPISSSSASTMTAALFGHLR